MGFFDSLRGLSDADLDAEREVLRLRYVAGEADLYDELNRYDEEITRRTNEAYERENPGAETKHREHGWYLPNDG